MLNTHQRVLVSEQIGVNKYKGRSDNNRIVEIEAPENIINKLINVKIVDVSKKNLTGILN
jgi:tRNA-2-methylthio-N6-dimethylallyladenosine synthase